MTKLEKEHTTSTMIPVLNISVLDEQFQVAQPTVDNIQTESVNVEHPSSATTSFEEHIDQERQSVTSTVDNPSHSNVGLSDQFPTYEHTPSTEQLTADSTFASEDNLASLNKHASSENEENKSSRSISNALTVSMIMINSAHKY